MDKQSGNQHSTPLSSPAESAAVPAPHAAVHVAAGSCPAAGRPRTRRSPGGCRWSGGACAPQREEPPRAAVAATPPSSFRSGRAFSLWGRGQKAVLRIGFRAGADPRLRNLRKQRHTNRDMSASVPGQSRSAILHWLHRPQICSYFIKNILPKFHM